MRKAISGVLVVAMMMSTFGASNVQAASINSGSNYVEDNGVIVEASVTDADDIEDAGEDTQEVTTEEREQTKGNLDALDLSDVDKNDYELIRTETIDASGKVPVGEPEYSYVSEDRKTADRIHYLNLNDGNPSHTSDAIVVESNGRYGLIDASNKDGDSRFGIGNDSSASGAAVLKYLAAIGVDHLDFVLATHSHSDHLGGIPDIVKDVAGMNSSTLNSWDYTLEETYKDSTGKEIDDSTTEGSEIINFIKEKAKEAGQDTDPTVGQFSLVDENTTYIYKSYTSNYREDSWGWANGAYYTAAENAMLNANKLLVNAHPTANMQKLGASFAGNGSGDYDDTISFKFGDFNISLYNLYSRSNTDENANSIITYIEKSGNKTALMADLDLYDNLENKIASAIVSQHGKINVIKVGHHGNTVTETPASTSKALIDTFGAETAIICTSNVSISGYTPFYGYMKDKGMSVYRTMDASGKAIVQDVTGAMSIKTGSIAACTESPVLTITSKFKITTQLRKYYGTPADESTNTAEVIRATKDSSEDKNITEVKTINQTTKLTLGATPSQWTPSGTGTNDWQKWYKSSSDYDWVHLNGNGTHKKGWQQIYSSPRGKSYTYYFGTDGIMKMGWTTIGGKRAYLRTADNSNGPQGSLATGWEKISGTWYYFNADGKGHEGWMQNNADWYYIDNGLMYTGGLRKISGTNYFFGSDGKMKTGWQKSGGNNYYFDSNGKAHSGWLQSNNKWYYTESSGKMVTSQWIDNYWIGSNGVWSYQYKGSWKSNSKGWWYEDASGWYPKSCWQKINGEYYYFGSDGYMAANEWIDGKWINGSGYSGRYKYTGSWKSNSKGWWFTDTSGWYPVNKWQKINGKWYYFEGDGYMASNKYIGGYWVNSSGAWE